MNPPKQSRFNRQPVSQRLVWALGAELIALLLILVFVSDLIAHKRAQQLGGLNEWGYRGPVVHAKRPREVRVELVGGTRAFGWGMVASATTAPAMYTRMLLVVDRPGTDPPPLSVINLGRLGDGAAAYSRTIEHFNYLRPDYICIYDDLGVRGADPISNDSVVFALTGYAPALPLALREKGFQLRFGSVESGYTGRRDQPQPSRFRRLLGYTVESLGSAMSAVDRGAGRRIAPGPLRLDIDAADYTRQMLTAIEVAHAHAQGVVLIVGPAELKQQRSNLAALERARQRFANEKWFRFVGLEDIPELQRPDLRLDGWNYGGEAIWAVARAITPAVLDLMGYR